MATDDINGCNAAGFKITMEEKVKPGTIVPVVGRHVDIGPPPDGGYKAWLQVLGSFFLFFDSW